MSRGDMRLLPTDNGNDTRLCETQTDVVQQKQNWFSDTKLVTLT